MVLAFVFLASHYGKGDLPWIGLLFLPSWEGICGLDS
jgi:hypothetical protein